MKKNRTILIVVILLAIIAAILFLTTSTSTFKRSLSDFAIDDTSNVSMIFMSDKNNNNLKLRKLSPGNWLVNDKYPGHPFNIPMLLGTMLNLQVKEPVAKSAQSNILRQLAVSSVKVEVYQREYRVNLLGVHLFPHEKRTKVYYVGGATPNNRGTYMLMEKSSEPFVTFLPGLRGFVSSRYMPFEKYWRDYSIFRKDIHAIASVKVEFPAAPENSFLVINHSEGSPEFVSLDDNRPAPSFDTIRVMNLLNSFRSITFETVVTGMDEHRKDSILSSVPFHIITLTDTAGNVYTAKTFRKEPGQGDTDYEGKPVSYDLDRMYALINDGQDFTLVQFFVFDRIIRPKTFYLQVPDIKRK